jgi:hypothetical protein
LRSLALPTCSALVRYSSLLSCSAFGTPKFKFVQALNEGGILILLISTIYTGLDPREMRDDFQVGLERDVEMTLEHGSQARLEIYICIELKERWISSRHGERLRLPSTINCVRDGH